MTDDMGLWRRYQALQAHAIEQASYLSLLSHSGHLSDDEVAMIEPVLKRTPEDSKDILKAAWQAEALEAAAKQLEEEPRTGLSEGIRYAAGKLRDSARKLRAQA